jgi:uncharacterized protein (TIGR03437 family)
MDFRLPADSLDVPGPQSVRVGVNVAGDTVPFKVVDMVAADSPRYIIVAPSSGVASTLVWVALDPSVVPYLPAKAHVQGVGFAPLDDPSKPCTSVGIGLFLSGGPDPVVRSVVNAATQQADISAGAVISIRGAYLGTPPITARYDVTGLYPTELGNTTVWVNDKKAPLLYVSRERIDAVIPHSLAGQAAVALRVDHNGWPSALLRLPLMATSPGVFTEAGNGIGPPILNQDGIPNGAETPAPRGSVIQMWTTGAGAWSHSPPDAGMLLSSLFNRTATSHIYLRPAAPVSLTVGGRLAEVWYAGPAPYRIFGVMQVNAKVPEGIESGPQSLVLTIGENSNAQQQVMLFVR